MFIRLKFIFMKIVHVVWSAKSGGAETMLVDILNCQVQTEDVTLLIINDLVDDTLLNCLSPKIKVRQIKRRAGSRNLFYMIKLNAILLFENFDVIHFHQDNIIRYVPIYRLKRNIFLTVHSVEMDIPSLPKHNYIFAVSTVVQEKLKKDHNLESMLVVNGIKMDDITKKQSIKKLAEYKYESSFSIVQVSRLEHLHKGQHILLKAIYLLVCKYHFKDVHLDIIGSGRSESYLKNIVNKLNLEEYVTFCGAKSKEYIQKNLHQYDLLVQPSLWEGFGLTAIEAMAALVPVLVSNIDGLKVNAQNGDTAFTFEPGDVEDCARMLYEIINLPSEEKEKKCADAYQYVVENFDVFRTANDYLSFYKSVI